jgi:CRISPR system Cascade subunit CasE
VSGAIHFTRAKLRTGRGTSGLAAFLAAASENIGRGHHLVWSLFDDHERIRPFVYRGLRANEFLLYSTTEPRDRHELWDLDTRPFSLPDMLRVGDRVQWSLRVNPVIKSGGKKHDVALRAWRVWCATNPDAPPCARPSVEDLAREVVPGWLAERLERRGLRTDAGVTVESHRRERFLRDPKRPRDRQQDVVVWMADVVGTGEITDPVALRAALSTGVGGAGAYGCGMLLLKRLG